MGWRFRHSFKVIPGLRLNLSKGGLSCSIGGAPLTLNVGPRGVYGTASLPALVSPIGRNSADRKRTSRTYLAFHLQSAQILFPLFSRHPLQAPALHTFQ